MTETCVSRGLWKQTALLIGLALWAGCTEPPNEMMPVSVTEEDSVEAEPGLAAASAAGECVALRAAGARPDLDVPVEPVTADTAGYTLRPFRGRELARRVTLRGYRYERAGAPPGPVFTEPFFRVASPYYERRALVMDAPTWCYGYLGPDGTYAIAPRFTHAGDFSGGVAVAAEVDSSFGYLGPDGAWVVPPRFEQAEAFEDGRAWVRVAGRWGRIDPSGVFVVAPRFEVKMQADERLFQVIEAGRVGLFDPVTDSLVVRPWYGWVLPPEGSVMRAATGSTQKIGTWGYLGRAGRWEITPRFSGVGPFQRDTAFALVPDPTLEEDHRWDALARGRSLARIDSFGRTIDYPLLDALTAESGRPLALVLPDSLFDPATEYAYEPLLMQWAQALVGPARSESRMVIEPDGFDLSGFDLDGKGSQDARVALFPRDVVFFRLDGYEIGDEVLVLPGAEFGEVVDLMARAVEHLAGDQFEVRAERTDGVVRFAYAYSTLEVRPTETGVIVRRSFGA